jgi:hypothetical protein
MKKKGFIRLPNLIILGIIIVAGAVFLWFFHDSVTLPGEKKAIVTDVATIMQDYKKNEAEADEKYLEKTIIVTGTIESISHLAGEITITLKEPNAMAGVLCYFPINVIDASYIKVGSEITVKGKCQGYFIDVLLTDCVLQK